MMRGNLSKIRVPEIEMELHHLDGVDQLMFDKWSDESVENTIAKARKSVPLRWVTV